MSPTRRLAAIMAVDVVGYSRLMGEDEAGRRGNIGTRTVYRPLMLCSRMSRFPPDETFVATAGGRSATGTYRPMD